VRPHSRTLAIPRLRPEAARCGLRISLASGTNGAAATEAATTTATATATTEAAETARANASAGETTAAAAADALFESRLAAATAGLPTLVVKIVKERLATLLLEKRMCFKNLREGRHGYKKKRALRNKAKRLRAQCMEAITIHNAWVDMSARLNADQLLSDSTSDTFPLQHLSSDTAPQSSVAPDAVREKAVRLSNVLERAREDIVLRQEEARNLKNVLKYKVEYHNVQSAPWRRRLIVGTHAPRPIGASSNRAPTTRVGRYIQRLEVLVRRPLGLRGRLRFRWISHRCQ
jgi:hypothetical protein